MLERPGLSQQVRGEWSFGRRRMSKMETERDIQKEECKKE